MKKKIAALAAGALMLGAGAGTAAALDAKREVYRDVHLPTTACKTESGPAPCYWDAGARGNKTGYSFWYSSGGAIHYLNPNK